MQFHPVDSAKINFPSQASQRCNKTNSGPESFMDHKNCATATNSQPTEGGSRYPYFSESNPLENSPHFYTFDIVTRHWQSRKAAARLLFIAHNATNKSMALRLCGRHGEETLPQPPRHRVCDLRKHIVFIIAAINSWEWRALEWMSRHCLLFAAADVGRSVNIKCERQNVNGTSKRAHTLLQFVLGNEPESARAAHAWFMAAVKVGTKDPPPVKCAN